MGDRTGRASLVDIQNTFDHFFNKGTTFSRIKDAALSDRLYPAPIPPNGLAGVAGRSIAWKLFLLNHEPLETAPVRETAVVEALRETRKAYKDLVLAKLKAPDGSYDTDLVLPGTLDVKVQDWIDADKDGDIGHDSASAESNTGKTGSPSASLELNNPLSLHNENPWNEWFTAVDIRKTILQDVERTFPDIHYFRRADVQHQLVNILFLYSVQHPAIGYRQGMHELLAPLYYAVNFDAIFEEQEDATMTMDSSLKDICSALWVAADAWALFDIVMRGVSRWYEWREPDQVTNAKSSLAIPTHVQLHVVDGQGRMQPYVAPIVQTCNSIQGTLLRAVDPRLYKTMQNSGVEPQIYGIRWLRLLFMRELNMHDALRLWDGLFACDPTFDLAQWICVAMLIRIRNELISTDYSGQLTLLLRYPSPKDVAHPLPHHAVLLLRQALALQVAPNPDTGLSVIIENKTILGIPMEIPSPVQHIGRKGHLSRQQTASTPGNERNGQGHGRTPSSHAMGIPEMIARGLLERGESLGINKTLMSAVSELRRNIPDLAASLVKPVYQTEAEFPLEDERAPQERPPWEPRSRLEMERDISQLRVRDKMLGDSLGWIVDVLLQDEEDSDNSQRLKKEKREAIESLSYIRDVLISDTLALEEDRLVGEEEASRRKVRARQRGARPDSPGVTASNPPKGGVLPPAPLPVIDSRSKMTGDRRRMHEPLPPTPFSVTDTSTKTGPGVRHAPWHYTPSGFSSGATVAPTALPRLPPPTSKSFRIGEERPSSAPASSRGESAGYSDPLGVTR